MSGTVSPAASALNSGNRSSLPAHTQSVSTQVIAAASKRAKIKRVVTQEEFEAEQIHSAKAEAEAFMTEHRRNTNAHADI